MTLAMVVVLGVLNPFVVLFGLVTVYVMRLFGLRWAAATVFAFGAVSGAMVARDIELNEWPWVAFWFAVVSTSVALTAVVISATAEFGTRRFKRSPRLPTRL